MNTEHECKPPMGEANIHTTLQKVLHSTETQRNKALKPQHNKDFFLWREDAADTNRQFKF
jgi:hypothetical protein